MLSRSLLTRNVALLARSGEMAASCRAPARSVMTVIDGSEPDHIVDMQLNSFAYRSIFMGSDPFPGYKRQALTMSDKRKRREDKKYGRKANYRVRALVDFIHLKNKLKFQE